MTVCPECGTDFDTIAEDADLPVQALQQQCPECDYDVRISVLNYPGSKYTVLAPALSADTCDRCSSGAMIRIHRIGRPQGALCAEHMGLHHESALEHRSAL